MAELTQLIPTVEAALEGEREHIEPVVSDELCPVCGKNLVERDGKFGPFLACPGYPECKNTKPITQDTGVTCPKCGSRLLKKKSKSGYYYYGCETYPTCEFMTWDKPTDDKCPQCGKSLFKRKGGLTVCLDEACGYEKKTERKSRKKAEE